MIIAKLIDGAMASKYADDESLKGLTERLAQINQIVSTFNHEANTIHKIADRTYLNKNNEGQKK